MSTIDTEQERNLSPNLIAAERNVPRYPNQFFDLSQQYMPPTIKELFRWCTFYFYNSPLIGAAIKKMSQYPITDLIIEHTHESVREHWDKIFNKHLKIKVRLLEVNLDRSVYGNCFVSLHLPFTRILRCKTCGTSAPIKQFDWEFKNHEFHAKCEACGDDKAKHVKDVPYKDVDKIRLLRWNPENIEIKHNEYTGNTVYLYTPPRKLRYAITHGDKDILEDMPLIVIDAVRENKKIRMNGNNFLHLKNPTLAEQDQGWGKPVIIHVLKDMFYFYTLRRAQEAIALEHIVPFDIIYPMPNAQMDPFVHTDLGDWRRKIEENIKKHRRDPNFKAVIPVPIGFGRLGGDGKALLLGPELQYLTQTIVGGMGIPNEFLFGGLNWTGSSVSLRTLENDFIQNRAQLLDLVTWIKDKVRIWLSCPDVDDLRFADFRMADDIQRNQQLIGLNAQGKVSDQTLLTELGYNFEDEVKKRLEEVHIQNYMNDLITKGQARSQGEAMLIQQNFQSRMGEIAAQASQEAQKKIDDIFKHDTTGQISALVQKLLPLDRAKVNQVLSVLKQRVPEIASAIEETYNKVMEAQQQQMQAFQNQQAQVAMGLMGQQMGVMPGGGANPASGGMPALPPAGGGGMAPGGSADTNPMIAAAAMESMQPAMKPQPEKQAPRRQGGA